MAMVSNVEAVTVVTAGAAIMEEEAEEACPMVSVATPVEEAVATNTTAVETTATVGETTEVGTDVCRDHQGAGHPTLWHQRWKLRITSLSYFA